MSVAARVLSQCMARPREGVLQCLKRVIRYLHGNPRCVLMVDPDVPLQDVKVWTDSDWAGDVASRKSCSGGYLQLAGTTVAHWSKLQSNVALSSGEAELNAAVKGVAEAIGVYQIIKECMGEELQVEVRVDANACRGILLRQGAGRVKHLCTKQLWIQGAVESYGVAVVKVPRDNNPADLLTHPSSRGEFVGGLRSMGFELVNPLSEADCPLPPLHARRRRGE